MNIVTRNSTTGAPFSSGAVLTSYLLSAKPYTRTMLLMLSTAVPADVSAALYNTYTNVAISMSWQDMGGNFYLQYVWLPPGVILAPVDSTAFALAIDAAQALALEYPQEAAG
jgi:hypothetical protein